MLVDGLSELFPELLVVEIGHTPALASAQPPGADTPVRHLFLWKVDMAIRKRKGP